MGNHSHTTLNKFEIDTPLFKKAASIFRAINNPVRLQIMQFLLEKNETNVTALMMKLRIEQSMVSMHLKILRDAKWVNTRRDGKCIYYSINVYQMPKVHSLAKQLVE